LIKLIITYAYRYSETRSVTTEDYSDSDMAINVMQWRNYV